MKLLTTLICLVFIFSCKKAEEFTPSTLESEPLPPTVWLLKKITSNYGSIIEYKYNEDFTIKRIIYTAENHFHTSDFVIIADTLFAYYATTDFFGSQYDTTRTYTIGDNLLRTDSIDYQLDNYYTIRYIDTANCVSQWYNHYRADTLYSINEYEYLDEFCSNIHHEDIDGPNEMVSTIIRDDKNSPHQDTYKGYSPSFYYQGNTILYEKIDSNGVVVSYGTTFEYNEYDYPISSITTFASGFMVSRTYDYYEPE